jgi:hypothetical protein
VRMSAIVRQSTRARPREVNVNPGHGGAIQSHIGKADSASDPTQQQRKLCEKQATVNGKLQKFNGAPEMSHLAVAV